MKGSIHVLFIIKGSEINIKTKSDFFTSLVLKVWEKTHPKNSDTKLLLKSAFLS